MHLKSYMTLLVLLQKTYIEINMIQEILLKMEFGQVLTQNWSTSPIGILQNDFGVIPIRAKPQRY